MQPKKFLTAAKWTHKFELLLTLMAFQEMKARISSRVSKITLEIRQSL
jgi:hypothetical protein